MRVASARDCLPASSPMREVTLFAGPSTFGLPSSRALRAGIRWKSPVRRGDIDRLVEHSKRPGVVIVCDGVFHGEPAVSHAELCRAIDEGWEVWGVSSIGAIRAFELRAEGMRGHGHVHAMFERFEDFTDDELCLLYFPEKPYFPVSEALVNLRFAFDRHGPALGIGDDAKREVIAELGGLWFGDRTEERMRSIMVAHARIEASVADRLLTTLRSERVKTLDLEDLLRRRPWVR